MTHIIIVDDHKLFREGLSFLLENSGLPITIREASGASELFALIANQKPDIVFMDIEMSEMNGIDVTKLLLDKFPEIKVLGLSMYCDDYYYSEMINAGAVGFLMKNSSFEQVKQAVLDVMEGKNYFSSEILNLIVSNLRRNQSLIGNAELTARELEVLVLICEGLSNHQIADRLFLSKRTIDKHRENILLKTNSKNTAELVVYAIRNRIFTI
ncbi:MAG: response regulator transcription factor [Bacteroidales bacterium]|nr:response regulator transcription factor [Bacteroidales bacterium]